MRLTRRSGGVLGSAVALVGVGNAAGYPLLIALGALAFGTVVAALAVTGRKPRLDVHREVYPDRVERGRPAYAQLRVRNPGTRHHPGFTAGDRVGTGVRLVTARPIAPGAEAVYHYPLPTGRRGRHQVGPLTLDRTDVLGLAAGRLSTGDTATLWVRPRTRPMVVVTAGQPRHHYEGPTTDRSLRGSFDLREIREYAVGDDVRHLHWTATAHTGQLMVRDYADPDQPSFTTLLDNRPEFPAGPLFEEAVDVAASLLSAAVRADHRCRLVTSGGLDVTVTDGIAGLGRVLDELCLLERTADTGRLLAPDMSGRSGGGNLVVVTSVASDADLAALAALRPRYAGVTVIAMGGHPGALRVPGATVLPVADAADAARRWNAVTGRW
jgi:uncharacterized protein (DUF58 family)